MISPVPKRLFWNFFYQVLAVVFLLSLVFCPLTFGFPQFEIFPKGKKDSDPRKFRLGRVQLHPGFAFESKYDDNVFLTANKSFSNGTSEGKEEDFIFTNKPSLGLELERTPGEIFGFNFNYEGEDEHFVNLGDSQNTFNHNLTGNLNFGGAGGRSDITVGGSYDKSRKGRTFDIQTNIGNRVKTETYTGLIDLIYFPSRVLRLQVGTDFEERRFGEPNQNFDSILYNFNGSIFWQKSPLWAYGVSYVHSRRDYQSSTGLDDSHTDQVLLGARWKATTWIEGELFVGFNSKRFDNLSSEDSQNLVYLIGLKYQPVERTRLTLRGSRQIRDTAFNNVQFLISHSVRLELAQNLGRKFQVEITSVYDHIDYRRPVLDFQGLEVKTRVDNRVEVSLALIYEIQYWLEAKAKYRYVQNFSNFDANDFINNVGLLEISAKY